MKDAISKELIHHLTCLNQYKYAESDGTEPAYLKICIFLVESFDIVASLNLPINRML